MSSAPQVGFVLLVLSCSLSPGLAGAAPSPLSLFREPLVLPSTNRAVQRAQSTLRHAHAQLVTRVDAEPTAGGIGFLGTRHGLGSLAFRNPIVLYKEEAANRTHIGYAFEMRVGDERDRPWVPVIVGRHGAIANRLFSGADSAFAQAIGERSADALAEVAAHDLAQRRPLDQASAWVARRQRGLGAMKPLVVRTGEVAASAPASPVAKVAASASAPASPVAEVAASAAR